MKKKSPRGIPDFSSRKPSKVPFSKMVKDQQPSRPGFDAPKVKPPATSSKSGRRGS